MAFNKINNSKASAADGRVDRLVQDTTVTREDIGQLVLWLQELDEKLSVAQAVQDVPTLDECVDRDARHKLSEYADHLANAWDAVRAVENTADTLRNTVRGLVEGHKDFARSVKEDIKRLQQQPPQQNVHVHHNHVYTPESTRLLWWAIGITFLIGALAHVI